MAQYNKSDLERRMAGAIEALKGDLTEITCRQIDTDDAHGLAKLLSGLDKETVTPGPGGAAGRGAAPRVHAFVDPMTPGFVTVKDTSGVRPAGSVVAG